MPKRRTPSHADRETLVAQAALGLLDKGDWAKLTLTGVARLAKLPLSDVLCVAPSKIALPGVVLRVLIRETAQRNAADAKSSDARERLFDVTMAWFDVQLPFAPGLKKLYRALQYDPASLLALRGEILDASGQLLALAEADFGFSPRIQSAAFAVVLGRAVGAWREDGDDMGKTMAQLDGDLRRVEKFLWPNARKADRPPASSKAESSRGRRRAGKRKYSS